MRRLTHVTIALCVASLAPAFAAEVPGGARGASRKGARDEVPGTYVELLDRYLKLAVEGEYRRARELVERAAALPRYDKWLEVLLEGATAVGVLEFRVEHGGDFSAIDGKDPSGAIALALLDLQAGDAPAACQSLARSQSAFGQDLEKRLRATLSAEALGRPTTSEKIQRELGLATGPAPEPPTPRELRRLFRGKLLSYDPKRLRVEILYDFSASAQLLDWEAAYCGNARAPVAAGQVAGPPPHVAKNARGMLAIRGGVLHMAATADKCALARGVFTEGTIAAEILTDRASGRGNPSGGLMGKGLLACADGRGNGYAIVTRPTAEWFGIMLETWCRGSRTPLNFPGISTRARPGATRMSLSFDRSGVEGACGTKRSKVEVCQHARGRFGLDADWEAARFDNVRISGCLDPRWVTERLAELRSR